MVIEPCLSYWVYKVLNSKIVELTSLQEEKEKLQSIDNFGYPMLLLQEEGKRKRKSWKIFFFIFCN